MNTEVQTAESTATVTTTHDPNTRERAEDGKFKSKEPASEVVTEEATEAGQPEKKEPEAKEQDSRERQRNRTRDHITKLETQNRELRALLTELRQGKQEPAKAAPAPDTFYANPVEFVQQYVPHAISEARQQWEAEATQRQQMERDQQAFQSWQGKIEALGEDVRDAIDSIPQELLQQDLVRAIIHHEHGDRLAAYLADNLGEMAQLAAMPAQYLPYAMSHIASRLTATHSEAPRPAEAVPARPIPKPPATVTTLSGTPALKKSPEKMTQKEYEQWRKETRKAKGLRD